MTKAIISKHEEGVGWSRRGCDD